MAGVTFAIVMTVVVPTTPSAAELRQRRALADDRRPDWEKYSRPEAPAMKSSAQSSQPLIQSKGKTNKRGTVTLGGAGVQDAARALSSERTRSGTGRGLRATPTTPHKASRNDAGPTSNNPASVPDTTAEDKALYRRILTPGDDDDATNADASVPGLRPSTIEDETVRRAAPAAKDLAAATYSGPTVFLGSRDHLWDKPDHVGNIPLLFSAH